MSGEGALPSAPADPRIVGNSAAVVSDIFAERCRQVEQEGWTADHDDAHGRGEMAKAAACYAVGYIIDQHRTSYHGERGLPLWPWSIKWWKPRDMRRNLVRAAALIVAEIERLDRAANPLPGLPPRGPGAVGGASAGGTVLEPASPSPRTGSNPAAQPTGGGEISSSSGSRGAAGGGDFIENGCDAHLLAPDRND